MTETKLKIEYRTTAVLKAYAGNARTHSPKQIRQLADSIKRFGFNTPIGVDGEGQLVFGHARLAAAKLLGLEKVPTIRIDHLSPAEKRAYIIADNRIAEQAGWSKKALASELALIIEADPGFDIELTGFDLGDVELLLDQDAGRKAVQDEIPEPTAGTPVTRPGELWTLGRHRLLCGSATNAASYALLLGRSRAQMGFTDPPYNVPINGHVSGKGRVHHPEFVEASGEMDQAEFTAFLRISLSHSAKASAAGALHFVCMDWRHQDELNAAGRAAFDERVNLCVWVKSNAGMGSLYRSQYELIAVFKRGTRPHINNVELGRHGRSRSNVWNYPGVNSFSATREQELAWHPTVKPLPLVADAILDASRKDGIILDPFGGSGTTLIAAEQTGRMARLMELDPRYCDVIIRRFEATTGLRAIDQERRSFAERTASAMEAARG